MLIEQMGFDRRQQDFGQRVASKTSDRHGAATSRSLGVAIKFGDEDIAAPCRSFCNDECERALTRTVKPNFRAALSSPLLEPVFLVCIEGEKRLCAQLNGCCDKAHKNEVSG